MTEFSLSALEMLSAGLQPSRRDRPQSEHSLDADGACGRREPGKKRQKTEKKPRKTALPLNRESIAVLPLSLADVSSQHVGDGGGTRLDLRRLQREPDDEPAGGVHPAVTISVAGIAAGPP